MQSLRSLFANSDQPSEGPRAGPFLAKLAFAIAMSAATAWRPGYAVFPTLAFVAWGWFLLTAVIEFPGEFGLIPEPENDPAESVEDLEEDWRGP